jgi:DNA-binding HxlR family transcriptional regulator
MVLMERPLRFNEMAEQLAVVSDRMLSERLKELEAEGVIERRVYPEMPVRVEYRLTEKGRALQPVVEAIGDWSHRWIEVAPAAAE